MKAKKLFALVLVLAMIVSLFPAVYAAPAETDPLSFADAKVTELTPKVDGETLKVTKYEDVYCATPNSAEQQLAVFVPENATANSPIIYMVDNSGWRSDAYATVKDTVASYGWVKQTNNWTGETKDVLVGDYKSGTDTDAVGECLANGYIIVVAGLRSRADAPTDGEYLGHSPATMTDAKAVIRYLKYNDAVIPGSSEYIVITGTSGGGALSVITAASGNSADYYESLYEIGAAGIVKNADGSYTDTLSDDIFATIAYCPITDLGNACAAYDWQWGDARAAMMAAGELSYKGASAEQVNANAAALTAIYEEYLDSLGLESVSAANLESTIIALMEAEIAEAIKEVGVEQMKADLGEATWLTFNEDGTFVYDYDAHVLWVAHQTNLKISPAFSNVGTGYGEMMNEDNLFGARDQEYAPFNEYSWSIDATENKVGLDDTGLTWDEYMATEEGAALALQIKMTNPIPYLLSEEGDSAPNWYVRYGMADRDSSFAVEAVLNAALDAAEDVEDKTFEYAWLKPHSGNYDVQEAYAWLKQQLAEEVDALSIEDAKLTTLTPKLDGEDFTVYMLEDVYVASPNRAEDQLVSVYVPENATADSPIILYVNNSGWQSNSYSGRNQVKSYGTEINSRTGKEQTVGDYVSDSDSDMIGRALSDGYVIVSYGCRSRNNGLTGDEYLGHSPATMTDTKAVVRWLRYNADLLPAGDPEKIVVTGTSGGGALSVVIAASGDSADYYESLYEVGAAGIELVDGKYVSTISDSVWGTIAYCPITDLGNACAGYEWTWGDARDQLLADGHEKYSYGVASDKLSALSDEMAAAYEEYVDSLGLETLTSENMKEAVIALMKAEIEESIKEVGIEQMQADLKGATWLTINDDGTYTYDYEAHLYWVGTQSEFKVAPAFSNTGMGEEYADERNEDNLFGSTADDYSPFNKWAWEGDAVENNVGLDDTGLTWEEFMATEDGQRLAMQIKMTSPIQYLIGDETEVTTAPHWYVRYGMADRDSSFGVETVLYHSMLASSDIESLSFEFAWLKGHSGNYDVQEAYDWLAGELDALTVADAKLTTLTPKLDGEDFTVYMLEDVYVASPNRAEDQLVSVYVPENATADSPIILYVNNSGWQSNSYSGRNQVKSYGTEINSRTGKEQTVGDYVSDSDSDMIGRALSDGYVIVSYGCRSRNNGLTGDEYLGHSPATMTDTKAVVRWLRYNADLLPAGDPEKIVVTGTSGGGALSVVIAASGDSADYYESLYEVGAAGIELVDGKYVSTISDSVWGTIAYCPITDLGNACAGYEWTWGDARDQLLADGHEKYSYGVASDKLSALSDEMAAAYEEYVDSLGLETLTSENMKEAVIALMKAEIEESIKEVGIEQMQADLKGATWLTINDDGTYTYDYEAHLYWVGTQSEFKVAPAFSNTGMGEEYADERNEDNLFGSTADDYSPFNKWAWEGDAVENNVGLDDTGLTWEEFMATEDGQRLAMQIKMTSPIQYLIGDETEVTTAPHWYVRYGMADRDSSFGVETVLYHSMLASSDIESLSFEFAWLKGHSGNYDVQEAYDWLASQLGFEDVKAGDWFADEVETVVSEGLMNGVGDNKFEPYGTASRAMIVTVLYRLAGSPAVETEAQFTDLTADWYKDAVAWAVANGITKGTSETTFEPDKAVTRQELATFLYRFAGEKAAQADLSKYADADQIAAWALEAMAWANAEGIITGKSDTTLAPAATSNRAELATILARYIAK